MVVQCGVHGRRRMWLFSRMINGRFCSSAWISGVTRNLNRFPQRLTELAMRLTLCVSQATRCYGPLIKQHKPYSTTWHTGSAQHCQINEAFPLTRVFISSFYYMTYKVPRVHTALVKYLHSSAYLTDFILCLSDRIFLPHINHLVDSDWLIFLKIAMIIWNQGQYFLVFFKYRFVVNILRKRHNLLNWRR